MGDTVQTAFEQMQQCCLQQIVRIGTAKTAAKPVMQGDPDGVTETPFRH
ncbi:hypothetical protein SSA02_13980 [Swaminathania salitolerans]|uniref:Uncharacterized protein n=1 Tax=Swaminathania salitolerans TaxID=182838 RepID=A0A511BPQ1_9PROT|nr:hypothetical protein SSA02_13980 [Swaminathania salitolerans]